MEDFGGAQEHVNATLKIDPQSEAKFREALGKIVFMAGKQKIRLMMEQMVLLLKDAMKLTPPMGDAPITESIKAQQDIGNGAVSRDIRGGNNPDWDSRSGVFRSISADLVSATKKAVRKNKNGSDVFVFFKKPGIAHMVPVELFRPDVSQQEMRDWHNKHRDRYGRSRGVKGRGRGNGGDTKTTGQMVVKGTALARYVKSAQAWVLNGKSPWAALMEKLQSKLGRAGRIPPALKKLRGFREGAHYIAALGTDRPILECGNRIPYMQKHADHIMSRAWSNRVRNIQKQAKVMEREFVKSLKSKGIEAKAT